MAVFFFIKSCFCCNISSWQTSATSSSVILSVTRNNLAVVVVPTSGGLLVGGGLLGGDWLLVVPLPPVPVLSSFVLEEASVAFTLVLRNGRGLVEEEGAGRLRDTSGSAGCWWGRPRQMVVLVVVR